MIILVKRQGAEGGRVTAPGFGTSFSLCRFPSTWLLIHKSRLQLCFWPRSMRLRSSCSPHCNCSCVVLSAPNVTNGQPNGGPGKLWPGAEDHRSSQKGHLLGTLPSGVGPIYLLTCTYDASAPNGSRQPRIFRTRTDSSCSAVTDWSDPWAHPCSAITAPRRVVQWRFGSLVIRSSVGLSPPALRRGIVQVIVQRPNVLRCRWGWMGEAPGRWARVR